MKKCTYVYTMCIYINMKTYTYVCTYLNIYINICCYIYVYIPHISRESPHIWGPYNDLTAAPTLISQNWTVLSQPPVRIIFYICIYMYEYVYVYMHKHTC